MIYPQTSSGGFRSSIYTTNGGRGRSHRRGGRHLGGRGRVNGSVPGRGCVRGGGNDKVINDVDIRNTNTFFTNEEWENMLGWERREMQQSDNSKHTINNMITETHNKKRRTSAVGITTEKQSVVAETITDFINAQ